MASWFTYVHLQIKSTMVFEVYTVTFRCTTSGFDLCEKCAYASSLDLLGIGCGYSRNILSWCCMFQSIMQIRAQ